MSAVTLGSAGGDETLVAPPSSTTVATKGLTEGDYITLTSDASSITISADQYQTIDSVCIVSLTSNTAVSNGATITLSFTTEILDPSGMHDNSTNPERITILEDGIYVTEFNSAWSADASTAGVVQHIPQTGTGTTISQVTQAGVPSQIQYLSCSGIQALTAGEYIIVTATNTSNVNKDVIAGTTLSVTKIGVL